MNKPILTLLLLISFIGMFVSRTSLKYGYIILIPTIFFTDLFIALLWYLYGKDYKKMKMGRVIAIILLVLTINITVIYDTQKSLRMYNAMSEGIAMFSLNVKETDVVCAPDSIPNYLITVDTTNAHKFGFLTRMWVDDEEVDCEWDVINDTIEGRCLRENPRCCFNFETGACVQGVCYGKKEGIVACNESCRNIEISETLPERLISPGDHDIKIQTGINVVTATASCP